ncbi:MAG: ABC transporter ATP-binding protein, partial [Paracoccaceae bacterium]
MTQMLLRLEGLRKSYPGVRANDDISFDIGVAEIHALLGENGAGKSTLVKMIYGLVKPDRGRMLLSQNPFAPREPREARAAGIGMVFQHFSLFEALSVAENIALGMDHPPSMRTLGEKIIEVSERYGLPLDPNRPIYSLSAGERQRVEIIRCLLQNPRLLIMDEPTSVLTPQEVDVLFATLRKLRENGTSILYISHKLDEIRALCDTATILRHGQKVATCTPSETTVQDLAEMMVGSSFDVAQRQEKSLGDVLLSVNNLSSRASDIGGISIRDISFEVRAGEILGIGGVAGNGQDELLALLSGERMAEPDMIAFQSTPVAHLNASDRRLLGINSAPEDRLGHA